MANKPRWMEQVWSDGSVSYLDLWTNPPTPLTSLPEDAIECCCDDEYIRPSYCPSLPSTLLDATRMYTRRSGNFWYTYIWLFTFHTQLTAAGATNIQYSYAQTPAGTQLSGNGTNSTNRWSYQRHPIATPSTAATVTVTFDYDDGSGDGVHQMEITLTYNFTRPAGNQGWVFVAADSLSCRDITSEES